MSDTTDVITPTAPSSGVPPAKTRRAKSITKYDPASQILTVTSADGTTKGYEGGTLPEATRAALFGRGFAHYLSTAAETPDLAYDRLLTGKYDGRKPAKAKDLDLRRLAIAYAMADAQAERAGLRPKPGKKLTADPGYLQMLDDAKQTVATWKRDAVNRAHQKSAVATHYVRLTATDEGSILDLVPDEAEPLAEAAD